MVLDLAQEGKTLQACQAPGIGLHDVTTPMRCSMRGYLAGSGPSRETGLFGLFGQQISIRSELVAQKLGRWGRVGPERERRPHPILELSNHRAIKTHGVAGHALEKSPLGMYHLAAPNKSHFSTLAVSHFTKINIKFPR